jgi:hypothetical protein
MLDDSAKGPLVKRDSCRSIAHPQLRLDIRVRLAHAQSMRHGAQSAGRSVQQFRLA